MFIYLFCLIILKYLVDERECLKKKKISKCRFQTNQITRGHIAKVEHIMLFYFKKTISARSFSESQHSLEVIPLSSHKYTRNGDCQIRGVRGKSVQAVHVLLASPWPLTTEVPYKASSLTLKMVSYKKSRKLQPLGKEWPIWEKLRMAVLTG